ncbi:hypothetical protein NQ317_001306 [Molorchus minor]|uniref:Uncharacterized protein n=1 Tax=Molorchus minor TaxID=1323400 RepID=A0ABQ9IUN5_9CUCU|nr:hypothetical protein NQ317_001306 [Molorchus minor]
MEAVNLRSDLLPVCNWWTDQVIEMNEAGPNEKASLATDDSLKIAINFHDTEMTTTSEFTLKIIRHSQNQPFQSAIFRNEAFIRANIALVWILVRLVKTMLAGLALVIVGILYKLNIREAGEVLPKDLGLAPILIIIGAIVFITAFLGCCGAVKESTCMLTTYAIVLLTIFIIQVAIAVYVFIQVKDSNELRN